MKSRAATEERIAFFLPSLDGGGAERATLALAAGVSEQGATVDLLLVRASGPFLPEVPASVNIVDLHASRTAFALLPLVRYLRKERPKALLATPDHASIIAVSGALLSGVGTITLVRQSSTFSLNARGLIRWLLPLAYRHADGVVAVSRGVAEDLMRTLRIPGERIRVLYNPVISSLFLKMSQEEIRHPWFAPGEPPVVLGVGRLTAAKDFQTLLRAFALARRRRALRLMILGQGSERELLCGLARELGVAEDVLFPGFVRNPFPYMRRAGAFVLSSAWEGLPNVLIQAIALGTPVVATDCRSGPNEICDGVPSAILVPVAEPVRMAAAIDAALAMERVKQPPWSLARFEVHTVAQQFLEFVGVRA